MSSPTPPQRLLFDSLPTPVVRFGPDLGVAYANPAADPVRTSLGDIRDAARVVIHTSQPKQTALAEYRVTVAPDGDGAVAVFTPRPAEDAEAARSLAEAVLRQMPVVAWLKDDAGRYVYMNPEHNRRIGSTPATWLGATDHDLHGPEVAARLAEGDDAVRASRQPQESTEAVRDALGELVSFTTLKFPVETPAFTGVGGIAFDTAQTHHYEQSRRKAEWQMFQAQKLESLGILAGGIAHDFNNLLTGVLGFASLAQMAVPEGGDLANWLGQIEKAAQRAADLCKQMLAYAGRGVFVITVMDLNKLVTEITQLLSTAISKSVVLRFHLAPGPLAVRCDATQIRQVLMNLITNASDAIGDRSGLITVTTGVIDADSKYLQEISAEYLTPGRYVYAEVSDTGAGMTEETRSRIFEPFYTTKMAGRGLGLSAVLGIVRAHQGALKVYTAVGKGTTFKVLLPAHAGPAETAATAVPGPTPFGRGRLALVIEDEEDIRVYARKTLELAGFDVAVAADGRAGLALFAERPQEFAVVLLDLTMPHLGGADTFRELRLVRPDVTVLLMSGFAAEEATAGFEGKGLAGFLRKPFRATDLLSTVQAAVDGEPS